MSLRVEPLHVSLSDWGVLLAGYEDRTIFQTPEWLSFVAETQQAEPVLASLKLGSVMVGCFSGLIVKKFGVKILGSPMPGWTTSYMGLNLSPGVSRCHATETVIRCAFQEWGCVHVECMDQRLGVEDAARMGWRFRRFSGFEIDLTQSESRLFASMTSACRRCIRRADKSGLTIEQARDLAFADDYHEQLKQVFLRQALVPPYGVHRVRSLIRHLVDTGHLLLLRACDPTGRCIATGIFLAMNDTMYFWGGASRRDSLGYRPNEALQWHAMKYWKAHGIRRYDMGGGGAYKRKFGGREIEVPWIRTSKYPGLAVLRDLAKRVVHWHQWACGKAVSCGLA